MPNLLKKLFLLLNHIGSPIDSVVIDLTGTGITRHQRHQNYFSGITDCIAYCVATVGCVL